MAEIITFSPSASIFGCGALEKLPEALRSKGYKRVMIFTDRQIAECGILLRVLDLLKGIVQFEVFDSVPAEPRANDIDAQREQFGTDYDALLGLGGGSPMDFAKAMSITMTYGGSLGDYVGEGTVPGPVIPVVCIPTTSGTGSQNTQTTVFTIRDVKQGTSSEYIRPVLSITDPELTMGLPAEITRNSGYDALMHACESFISRPHFEVPERKILYQGSNPFSRPIALDAFRSIWSSYRRAVSDGEDRQARMGMSLGSHMAGMAFSFSGLGLVHALASSLGGMINVPHGVCLAACTRIGLNYNMEVCRKDLEILAGITSEKKCDQLGASAEGFLDDLETLISDLGLPARPSELGIKKEDAETVLQKTLIQVRRIITNPRPLDEQLLECIRKGI